MSRSYRYKTLYQGPYDFDMETDMSDDLEWVAEEAAKDYFYNHDGIESRWPRDFTVLSKDNEVLGVFTVELEFEPAFIATKNKL